ncbi:MAG: 30S ribosomal protein S20 [Bacilli bacterium]|nr:30S ribosomal protein S20 [Bacilli bacterium]
MAQIKSQMKRIGTNEKSRQRNVSVRSEVRTASKKVRVAVEAKDVAAAETALKAAIKLIDSSVSAGVTKRNTAARQKSSLQKLVNGLKA